MKKIPLLILSVIHFVVFPTLRIFALARQPNLPITSATPKPEDIVGKEAMFYRKLPDNKVQCQLCFRECEIKEGQTGFCRARKNRKGELISLVYGQPSAVQLDPVEKEPQHHFLPGTMILCLGTVGCNFQCQHCHNWHLSQSSPGDSRVYNLSPQDVIDLAQERDVPTISFTYNDPIVMYEYVYDVAKLAQKNDLRILWHSNGSINPEPLRKLLNYTDAVTIDLKGFSDEAYENSRAILQPVLTSLEIIREEGVWLEIVNLVIPTINDDKDEIREMARWIKNTLGPDVPLHFSRFFPNYRLTHISATPIRTLEEAYEIASEEGINYITIGNVPGHKYNSTFCSGCGQCIIQRRHFQVLENKIEDGKCNYCAEVIPGVWE